MSQNKSRPSILRFVAPSKKASSKTSFNVSRISPSQMTKSRAGPFMPFSEVSSIREAPSKMSLKKGGDPEEDSIDAGKNCCGYDSEAFE